MLTLSSWLAGLAATLALLQISLGAQAKQLAWTTYGPTDQVVDSKLYDSIQNILKENNVPGYSVAIIRPNVSELDEFVTWGKRTEDRDPVTPDTLFTLASVSKAFTATAVGILMEDYAKGTNVTALPDRVTEFSWQTKIKDLLPNEWALMEKWANDKATVHDLLSHVTGVPRHDFSYGLSDTPKDIIRRLRYLRPAYELRERYHYNNQPFILVSYLVSKYSGMTFQEFVKTRIFEPVDMSSSTYLPSIASKTGRFTQSWAPQGRRIPNWFDDDIAHLKAGAGGVISSARDMAQWVRLLLGARGGVTRSVLDDIMRPHVNVPSPNASQPQLVTYGMGWSQSYYRGHYFVQHSGGIPGISTLVTLFPQDDFGIIQLANADDKARINSELLHTLVDAVFGLPTDDTLSVADAVNVPPPSNSGVDIAAINASLSLSAYTGTYSNLGYGEVTLCSSESTSTTCRAVTRDFATIDAAKTLSPVPPLNSTLFIAWDRIWARQFRVYPNGLKDQFNLMPTNLFPNGYGKDTSPFETARYDGRDEDTAWLEFVVEDGRVIGFGIFGQVQDDEVLDRERKGTASVKSRAEVWLQRAG